MTDKTKIETVLNERELTYGKFSSNAKTSQIMKQIVTCGDSWQLLDSSHKEAISMIIHKLSRIINGNPNIVDSWLDIAGYATLIVKDIEGDNNNAKND